MNEKKAKFACETYAYHGQLGLARYNLEHCKVVQDTANPDVWSSNKAYAVTARTDNEIEHLMRELVQKDYAEGGRTQGKILSAAVTDGIIANYQAKQGECQFFIAELDAQPCA